MHSFIPFSDEQRRLLSNLDQHYSAWMDARKMDDSHPRVRWKEVKGYVYLYRKAKKRAQEKAYGRRSEETERIYQNVRSRSPIIADTLKGTRARLHETCALYTRLKLGRIATDAAKILQFLDFSGVVGTEYFVVGTNAFPAYEGEADHRIVIGAEETDDFDLTWCAKNLDVLGDNRRSLLNLLMEFDPSFRLSARQAYQLVNKDGYEVELLAAPSVMEVLKASGEILRPVDNFIEQEWLLNGTPVDRVVCGLDRTPARIVAPDPRWMALHKLWLSEQLKRNILKRPKDRKQGIALIDAVEKFMPHYPINDTFKAELPIELDDVLKRWQAGLINEDNWRQGGLIPSQPRKPKPPGYR